MAYYTGDATLDPSTSNRPVLTVLNPSVTRLSVSHSTVTYGHEEAVRFRVRVSAGAPGIGVPTGDAVVESGTKVLCSIDLLDGRGVCFPASGSLTPGSHKIVAYYAGNTHLGPSLSGERTLHVVSPSVTALSLSRATVTYGHEHLVRFMVSVSAGAPGTEVPDGLRGRGPGRRSCAASTFTTGAAACSPSAMALAPGLHAIVAHYAGDTDFAPSTSS